MARKTTADWVARIAHYKRMMARCYVYLEREEYNSAMMALIDTPERKNVGINRLDMEAAAKEIQAQEREAKREHAESLIERGQAMLEELNTSL